jgi:branched-chain amino acid transport system substrate-binding protein
MRTVRIAKMKELPTEDRLMGKGYVRIDGRKIHPMYLFEVKKPEESKAP